MSAPAWSAPLYNPAVSCTVIVTRGSGAVRREPCGHEPADHVTMTEAFTMIEAQTYCRACFGELGVALSDTEHEYSGPRPGPH
jgi:hypothetical protein